MRTLSSPIGLSCPEQPHLGAPSAQDLHLSSWRVWFRFLPELCCRYTGLQHCILACLQSCFWPCLLDGSCAYIVPSWMDLVHHLNFPGTADMCCCQTCQLCMGPVGLGPIVEGTAWTGVTLGCSMEQPCACFSLWISSPC